MPSVSAKAMHRKPSHFGSYVSDPAGSSRTSRASIGVIGGRTGDATGSRPVSPADACRGGFSREIHDPIGGAPFGGERLLVFRGPLDGMASSFGCGPQAF